MQMHTPGPWRIDPGDSFAVVSEDFGGIAVMREPIRGGNAYEADVAICRANARLIAAAPELLATLQACAALLHDRALDDESLAVLRTCDAAIAKAEGR